MNDSGKHSSLLQYGNNYSRKKFYNTGPRLNLQIDSYGGQKSIQ